MFRGVESITVFSENPKELADFYRDKVGLKRTLEAELGEGEELFGFETGQGSGFYIVYHSQIKGKNTQPERIIVNFEVDNIEAEVKRLEANGVKKIQDVYHVENYGLIATFEDLDGNYFQLVKVRE